MIPREDRLHAVQLIEEACEGSARLFKACQVLSISVSTFRRWKSGDISDKRKGAGKHVARKLTPKEEDQILEICCSKQYADQNPRVIHASLLDTGVYVASVSSFYRLLRRENLLKHRGRTRPGKKQNKPPALVATGPNQVWTWDITWLKTDVQGRFFYGYTIIDIWDRSIVRWAIYDREDEALSHELFQLALRDNGYPIVHVHSDNGNPMRGMTLMAFFQDLGLSNSFSRPRVSDDNPYIEAWFKTMKYSVTYPKNFKAIEEARGWFANFVASYNDSHKHSGLYYMTPKQVRSGQYTEIARKRNQVMLEAQAKNPLRWSGKPVQLPEKHSVWLNPSAETRLKIKQEPIESAA